MRQSCFLLRWLCAPKFSERILYLHDDSLLFGRVSGLLEMEKKQSAFVHLFSLLLTASHVHLFSRLWTTHSLTHLLSPTSFCLIERAIGNVRVFILLFCSVGRSVCTCSSLVLRVHQDLASFIHLLNAVVSTRTNLIYERWSRRKKVRKKISHLRRPLESKWSMLRQKSNPQNLLMVRTRTQ